MFTLFACGRRIPLPVGATKQVAESLPPEQRPPSPPLVLGLIVQDVTALAEGSEVRRAVVSRVIVPVRGGEHHPRRLDLAEHVGRADFDADEPAGSVAPGNSGRVPPPAIAQAEYGSDRAGARSPRTGPWRGRSGSPPESCNQSIR